MEGSAGISDFINKYKKTVDSSKSGTLTQKADKIFALTNIATILNKSKFLKAGLNAVPFIKTAFNIMDFFIGGGKSSKGNDSIALMPLSINMDLTVKGTLSTGVNILKYDFLNPGSLSAGVNDNFYPFYNNTMGVFNLLVTPRINFSKRNTSFVSDFCYR